MFIETTPIHQRTETTDTIPETRVQTNLLQLFNTTSTIRTSSPRNISYMNMGNTPNQRMGNWLMQLTPNITTNSPNLPAICPQPDRVQQYQAILHPGGDP